MKIPLRYRSSGTGITCTIRATLIYLNAFVCFTLHRYVLNSLNKRSASQIHVRLREVRENEYLSILYAENARLCTLRKIMDGLTM